MASVGSISGLPVFVVLCLICINLGYNPFYLIFNWTLFYTLLYGSLIISLSTLLWRIGDNKTRLTQLAASTTTFGNIAEKNRIQAKLNELYVAASVYCIVTYYSVSFINFLLVAA